VTGADKRSWVEQVMGLPVSVLVRGDGARGDGVDAAVQLAYADLREADARFSPYLSDSEVSRLGRGEAFEASPDLLEVQRLCDQAHALTGGAFDARTPLGIWDPSGMVKGWAAERASARLAGLGLDWCLNAGGDVVVDCPSGEPFRVGISDPLDPRAIAAVAVRLSGAVATSGTSARGAHLYDPSTGTASTSVASVTVSGPSLLWADVLATAAFVRGVEVLPDGYQALVISLDGSQAVTAGWAHSLSKISPPAALMNPRLEVER